MIVWNNTTNVIDWLDPVPVLMLFYSVVAGTGLGLMYVPAVVAVGYYFEKKRAFATGKIKFPLIGIWNKAGTGQEYY